MSSSNTTSRSLSQASARIGKRPTTAIFVADFYDHRTAQDSFVKLLLLFRGTPARCNDLHDRGFGLDGDDRFQGCYTVLQRALAISEITRLEIHAPAAELDKLRKPLADLKPQMFAVEMGFRK